MIFKILTRLLFVLMFQSIVAQTPGSPYFSPILDPSTGGTAMVSAYNCTGTATGVIINNGVALSGITKIITATVSKVGSYSISTTSSGITYEASGTFVSTGTQNVTLVASGIPTIVGLVTFNLSTSPSCSFTQMVTYGANTNVCSTVIGTFPTTTTDEYSNPVTITKPTNTNGGVVISTAECDLGPTGNVISLGNGQSVTYNFNVPISDVQVYGLSNQLNENEGYSVSAIYRGVSIPIQLIPIAGSCLDKFTTSQSGNSASIIITGNYSGALTFDIKALDYYDSITITRLGTVTGDNRHGLLLCNSFTTYEVSSGGSAVVSAYNCSGTPSGIMTIGTNVAGVTQIVTATVTTKGTYNISILVNGVTFAGSGTFTGTGAQNITLTATGTPTAGGSFSYELNTTPSCSFSRFVNYLPANITLSAIPDYNICSIYDTDYWPYTAPTGPAELPSGSASEVADGINESKAVDIPGKLTTTGVTITIPYTVTTAPVSLPAYSKTITIPIEYTEDGFSRDITFSYNAATLPVGSGTITATLKSLLSPLNVKKLDTQTGLGTDNFNLGILMAQFTYSTNNSNGTSNFEVRITSGILDKMFNINDNSGGNSWHRFIYFPVTGADGRTWLNNNLGAKYSQSFNNLSFNPGKQATSSTDHLAYGSCFQWGRKPDGHELFDWTGSTAGTSLAPTVTTRNDFPTTTDFISHFTSTWRVNPDSTLWSAENSVNNPCPKGYRLPTETEFTTLVNSSGISNVATAASSLLKFTSVGFRIASSPGEFVNLSSTMSYWTSISGRQFTCNLGVSIENAPNLGNGQSVRCIKD